MLLPLHQQPMAWAARSRIASLVPNSDNKPRMWLTVMK
ncbi:glutathione transportersolute-binding component [Bosea sp. BIWAKO-01]|nr:glutathione transportersolute-binding component [Bosea sp. BIWAKO-01]